MIELSTCPECGSCSINQLAPRADKYRMMCRVCGFRARFCDTPDEAVRAWNELCEWIRVGKAVMMVVPDDHQLRRLPAWGSMYVVWDTEFIPAPAPALDPLDLLRRWNLAFNSSGSGEGAIMSELITDTAAVLAQPSNARGDE